MKVKDVVCKHCAAVNKHQSFQCLKSPKNIALRAKATESRTKPSYTIKRTQNKPIPKTGKRTKEYLAIRKAWFEKRPSYYYTCALRISPNCHNVMPKNETTLDHIIPKSNAKNYANRHDDNNLQPVCYPCNGFKGSKH